MPDATPDTTTPPRDALTSCSAPGCSEVIGTEPNYLCGNWNRDETPWGCGRFFCWNHSAQEVAGSGAKPRGHECAGINKLCRGHDFEPGEGDRADECIRQENQFSVCGYTRAVHPQPRRPSRGDTPS